MFGFPVAAWAWGGRLQAVWLNKAVAITKKPGNFVIGSFPFFGMPKIKVPPAPACHYCIEVCKICRKTGRSKGFVALLSPFQAQIFYRDVLGEFFYRGCFGQAGHCIPWNQTCLVKKGHFCKKPDLLSFRQVTKKLDAFKRKGYFPNAVNINH